MVRTTPSNKYYNRGGCGCEEIKKKKTEKSELPYFVSSFSSVLGVKSCAVPVYYCRCNNAISECFSMLYVGNTLCFSILRVKNAVMFLCTTCEKYRYFPLY